jgi:hypothetical protein
MVFLMSRVFQGSTDARLFEDFIEQLLHHSSRWPEPRSVLIMDNASFHHTIEFKNYVQMLVSSYCIGHRIRMT